MIDAVPAATAPRRETTLKMHRPSSPILSQALASRAGYEPAAASRDRPATQDLAKRALDIAGASALLLGLLPVLLVLMAILRAGSSPVFYRHMRIGLGGRAFACLKLCTMRADGDKVLEDLLRSDPAARQEWQQTRKLRDDPRITPIGRFLRSTSLDELPQLFNVLRGEMSLVGPRPVVARELEEHYGPDAAELYCSVRPGLTGLWQVSGRSGTSYKQRVELDARYVRERSLAMDVKILLRTPIAVLRRDGAC
ncbi:MAG: sugar transferase [Pseudomonadota bacterium]